MENPLSGLKALFGGLTENKPAAPTPAPPTAQIFTPTFKKPVGYGPNGYVNKYMNPDYFATSETADFIMRRVGATEKFERVAPGNEGPLYTCSELQWWLRFDDGLELNAGTLAAYFVRCPEDQFPGLADSFVRDYIALARREKAIEEKATRQ
jgi:hypothetical protein